jgi:hypothetical protein
MTMKNYTSAIFDIYRSSVCLLREIDFVRKKVRLVGISVGSLKKISAIESELFKEERKDEKLTGAIKKISDKFGDSKVTIAGIKEL